MSFLIMLSAMTCAPEDVVTINIPRDTLMQKIQSQAEQGSVVINFTSAEVEASDVDGGAPTGAELFSFLLQLLLMVIGTFVLIGCCLIGFEHMLKKLT